MKFPVPPFLVPQLGVIQHNGWNLSSPSGENALPAEMDHWDYQTTISITGMISINLSRIMEQCHLHIDSKLGIVVLARSSSTNVEQLIAQEIVPARENSEVRLSANIAGAEHGGRLTIETLVLAISPIPVDELAAIRPGSILWKETHHTYLQGVGTQFPTDAEDFAQTCPDIAKAGWKLSVDCSDLDALFMSTVRLSLNTGHSGIRKLLSGRSDAETRRLQRLIDVDVTRQLIAIALKSEDIIALDLDWEAVSLGDILRNLLQQVWPTGEDPQTLRDRFINDPSRIESHIQHTRGILE